MVKSVIVVQFPGGARAFMEWLDASDAIRDYLSKAEIDSQPLQIGRIAL